MPGTSSFMAVESLILLVACQSPEAPVLEGSHCTFKPYSQNMGPPFTDPDCSKLDGSRFFSEDPLCRYAGFCNEDKICNCTLICNGG